jgi:N-methylhydantoinase B
VTDAGKPIDPVTLEILWTRITSVVDEAAATFVRTSFSTLVREANDYAVVLTDRRGRNIAQSSQSIPSFICTMPSTIRHFLSVYGADGMREGDAYVTNDPWLGSGHLNDASLAMPLFRNGRLIAFAGVVSHLPDIGGRFRSPSNVELFEEGLQIPPSRLLTAGEPDATLVSLIRANVRVPDETMGDLWAQIACCRTLGERLGTLLDEIDIDLDQFADEVVGRTDAAMRQAIAEVPDGTYRSVIENDGTAEIPGGVVRIPCAVTIRGDRVAVDYAGCTPQVNRAINTVYNYTFAYSAYALKAVFAPWIPNAEGSFMPITITAPERSILNPVRPAPCSARGMIGHLLPPAIFAALAKAIPDRVQAAPGSPSNSFQLSSMRPGQGAVVNGFIGAGQGAGGARDGRSAISFPSNLSNTPIEVLESLVPIEVLERGLRRGSGGAGARRGGDGLTFHFTSRGDDPIRAAFLINRVRSPAPGLRGGAAGAAASFRVNGHVQEPSIPRMLVKGDVVQIESGGGGGFGKPAKPAPARTRTKAAKPAPAGRRSKAAKPASAGRRAKAVTRTRKR